ncbi:MULTISPECIES: hypothetical protein [Providencia]|uniref:hypothetical protein n=1 Tax=Providencia TaxID=586 RepID=UPI00234BA656|nr:MULTISPECIES: hypothetical protein [Providencia]MDH2366264.1 hypothetical protein [Providencia rettgeri]
METSTSRIQRHLEQLAEYTATPGQGTTRMSYSEQDKQARDYLKQEMRALGLHVREDAIGNIYGVVCPFHRKVQSLLLAL